MRWFLVVGAALHAAFMIAELFPWSLPFLLNFLSKKLPSGEPFTKSQRSLVATIVHNAGIYNGILAGGLVWSAFGGASLDVARAMLAGAAVAGVFGTATLKSPATAVQAAFGIIGLFII